MTDDDDFADGLRRLFGIKRWKELRRDEEGGYLLADGSKWAPRHEWERPPPPFLDGDEPMSTVFCVDCSLRPSRARCAGCPLERSQLERRHWLYATLAEAEHKPPRARWRRNKKGRTHDDK